MDQWGNPLGLLARLEGGSLGICLNPQGANCVSCNQKQCWASRPVKYTHTYTGNISATSERFQRDKPTENFCSRTIYTKGWTQLFNKMKEVLPELQPAAPISSHWTLNSTGEGAATDHLNPGKLCSPNS